MKFKKNSINWHPFHKEGLPQKLPTIVSAQGIHLIDASGKKYIDAISSWWVNLHGHCHPKISSAIAEQASKLDHCMYAGFEHEKAEELSQKLLKILPKNQKKIFYSDNGSTAVEIGLKMAIQSKWNSHETFGSIVCFDGGYHGDTLGAMSLSDRNRFSLPFRKHLFPTLSLPYPNPKNAESVLSAFRKMILKEHVTAIVFEPLVQGVSGFVKSSNEVMSELLKICEENSILSIADEVMTGFGRTGELFASLGFKHSPDIMCLAKGLTGGSLPLAVTTCSHKIYEKFCSKKQEKALNHGHSYTANPIACAAAIANLDLLLSEESKLQRKQLENFLRNSVSGFQGLQRVKEVRHCGCILAIEVKDKEEGYYSSALPSQEYYLERGVNLRPLGNVLYTIPPYCIRESDLKKTLEIMFSSLES